MKFTSENITSIGKNDILVFGSNDIGVHGAGLALLAKEKFGAKHGDGYGRTGQCYAIATKKWSEELERKLGPRVSVGKKLVQMPLEDIKDQVDNFRYYIHTHTYLHFLVTKIGCDRAGYTPAQIAPLFYGFDMMDNVSLPKEFHEIITRNRVK